MDHHVPVLLSEVLEAFLPLKERKGLIYYDGTFGRGGHYSEIKKNFNLEKSFATDQDEQAISYARKNFPEVEITHENFLAFAKNNINTFDMALLDLGVSSPQLDEASRGFSFNKEGPLDMRMNQKSDLTAANLVNEYSDQDLIDIFKEYGEVQNPLRVVRAIVQDRVTKPFTTTLQLAQMIERIDGWQKKGFHPATQYFMALRLVVNRELQVVDEAVPKLIEKLRDGGRLAIITFHSLEDRLVKNLFKDSGAGFSVSKKVIVPSEEECKLNPRARSAKLRIFQKGPPPEKPDKFALRRAQRDS